MGNAISDVPTFMPPLASSPATQSQPRLGGAPSPAFDLLLACCSIRDREDQAQAVHACLEGVKWYEVLRSAEHHGVSPLVYHALHDFPQEVPSDAWDDLRSRYEHNARKNLKLTNELFRILNCLEVHGIVAIPYKGPVLAEAIYGDLALREFSDLDILIRPGDVQRARLALGDLGYALNVQLSRAHEPAYLTSGYEYTFDGPAGKNLLEIQWAILPRFYAVDFSLEAIFERAAFAELGGRRVLTLCPEDLLLALCVHAAKHAWTRLCWLRDIAAVVSQSIDWTAVEQTAVRLGIRRIVGVSLKLTQDLLAARLPESRFAPSDSVAESLCREIATRLPRGEHYSTESLEYFKLMMRSRERISDKVSFASRLAFTPGMGEWQMVRLPRPLFPLYRGVRLVRITSRFMRYRRRS
jgi:Uncharacterised nucleotidyltransferase